MARSLASISKRSKTIKTTQKITNAMKLVSMSKLLKFKSSHQNHASIMNALGLMDHDVIEEDKKSLYILFFPDMGLVSSFTKQLREFVREKKDTSLLVIGNHGYDNLKNEGYDIVNEKISSDQISLGQLHDITEKYADTYTIWVVIPRFSGDQNLWFHEVDTSVALKQNYDQLYEPSYDHANNMYRMMFSKGLIMEGYYLSKIAEYTMRRIAMEKATESADSMLHDLQLQYNRLRQERITEELSDLMSEEG